MNPFWQDDHLTLYGGDCRSVLAELEAGSVHCVVTSPPYWGLRDYGVSDQLGLEPTPEEYVANMVAVFREVRRVLRDDGTLWLNLGDSYSTGGGAGEQGIGAMGGRRVADHRIPRVRSGMKPKDLVGIPWRVAFALQTDGWYLRSDIIWSKPNPMPESVTDRPTKAHEYLFLLSKSPRYYFDADAVREPPTHFQRRLTPRAKGSVSAREGLRTGTNSWEYDPSLASVAQANANPAGRNLRSVWTIATEPYPGAHFATFPRKLVEPCVKAGTSERGVCPECGALWVRVVERTRVEPIDYDGKNASQDPQHSARRMLANVRARRAAGEDHDTPFPAPVTTGWRPSCDHVTDPVPATVLDPFAGSGTTLLVAQSLGRRGVGIDLNPEYLKQALVRNAQTPLGLVG